MSQAGKLSPRAIQELNLKGFGTEPEVSGLLDGTHLVEVLNWYTAMKEKADAKQYLLDFATSFEPVLSKTITKAVERVAESDINRTMAWLSRVVKRGADISDTNKDKLERYVTELLIDLKQEIKLPTSSDKPTHKDSKSDLMIAELELIIDNMDDQFKCYEYLATNCSSPIIAAQIEAHYKPVLVEIDLALNKADDQCVQAYRCYSSPQLKKLKSIVEGIINDCSTMRDNIIKARKPKKKSTKVKKEEFKLLKYCIKYDPMQLSSISPAQIVGARELYMYNISNNSLTVLWAKEGGFQISRSSVTNYDEDKSRCKRAGRNLAEVVKQIDTQNARGRAKIFDQMSAEDRGASGRINTNVVLLRAFR